MSLQQLQSLHKALAKASHDGEYANSKSKELQDILRRLSEFDAISVSLLAETKIGFTVKKLKRHPVVGEQARRLLQLWKQVLAAEEQQQQESKKTVSLRPAKATRTTTTVCNVKVAHIRPKGYQNLQVWMEDPKNVYIGRGGVVFVDNKRFPPKSSNFHNPFKLKTNKKDGTNNLAQVLADFESYIRQRLKDEPGLGEQMVRELDGKCLGCWCKPSGCHGDILKQIIEELKADKGEN